MTQQKRTKEDTFTNNKRLSVQIALTGLSFLITDAESHEMVHFSVIPFSGQKDPEEILDRLMNELESNIQLKGNFEEVVLRYSTPLYTIVPESLFDETKASEYLKFNSKILAGDFIAHDKVESLDAVVVYVPLININNAIYERFGSFQYFHATSILLNKLKQIEKRSQESKVYLYMLKDRFDLLIFDKGSLLLCNSYRFNTPEDFIYYVLFGFEQLDLNPDSVELSLMGKIDKDDSYYAILYTYIRHISFFDTAWLDFIRFGDEKPHQSLIQKILV